MRQDVTGSVPGARPEYRAAGAALGLVALLLFAACSATDAGLVVGEPLAGAPREGAKGLPSEALLSSPAIVADATSSPSIVAEAETSSASGTSPRSGRGAPGPRAGVVTAGDIDDGLNWPAFERYASRARRALGLPALVRGAPVRAQVVGPGGQGAPGVPVTLRRRGSAEPFWSGVSGVDGWVSVFPRLVGGGRGPVELRAFSRDTQGIVTAEVRPGQPTQVQTPFESAWEPDFLDLVIVLDTTGSMGDELAWLAREAEAVVARAARSAQGVDVRYGLITYRDTGDAYVARRYGFTRSSSMMTTWLMNEAAGGGGDRPEASHVALAAAADMPWRRGHGERLLFHVADAPPHARDAFAQNTSIEALLARNVQVFGLAASGSGPDTEYMMRQAAIATQGRYMFLTDDSGIGNAHDEPSIACYQVTSLKDLLERVITSELTGKRVEPKGAEIVRQVGIYRGGACAG